jgi:hypothetical protein
LLPGSPANTSTLKKIVRKNFQQKRGKTCFTAAQKFSAKMNQIFAIPLGTGKSKK